MSGYGVYLDTDGEVFLHLQNISCIEKSSEDWNEISLGYTNYGCELHIQPAHRGEPTRRKAKFIMSEEDLWKSVLSATKEIGEMK